MHKSTATLGRLTTPHWKGYTASSPSLKLDSFCIYPETVSLQSGECLWGFVNILTKNFKKNIIGLLSVLKNWVSDRLEVIYEKKEKDNCPKSI